ncbi:MAG: electron transport protein SCO1/SenC [Bacteroidetes bacterium]|nr:electron transport protein SCO1/SenC [Bacteroidota bacterium]
MKLKVILNALVLFTCLVSCHNNKTNTFLLPVYGEKKIGNMDTIYHTVGEFNFTNQYGEAITNATVKNKIYVADFFFATCQSICPEMSKNLTQVQKEFANDDSLLILSHSVNPRHDTVQVLKNYSETYGARKNKWHFLTGDKKQIYELAKTSYLVNALEDDGSAEGFLHSELFLLVDTKGRVRGMYDGTDHAAVTKLISDIKLLKKEKN